MANNHSSSSTRYGHSLPGLSPYEQIDDEISGRPPLTGLSAITHYAFDSVGPMDTQHLGCPRVELQDGAATARVTLSSLNQHFPAGQGLVPGAAQLLDGCLYDVKVVKDVGGEWRMQTWKISVV